jgi:hypothetical protein
MTKDSLGLDSSPLNYTVGCVVYLGINLSFNANESVVVQYSNVVEREVVFCMYFVAVQKRIQNKSVQQAK